MRPPLDDREIKISDKRARSQRGSVFTVLLAGIAIAGALSVVLYQTISGPMSSMVRVSNKTSTKSQMQAIANIIVMDAVNNMPNGGDCSGASYGFVVPRSPNPTAPNPTGGGEVPGTIGAPLTDPWGTPYGYCMWEVGVPTASLPLPSGSGCDISNGYNQTCTSTGTCSGGTAPNINTGYNAKRLVGTPTPATGTAGSEVVIAIISAGPDRKFQSTCSSYVAASPGNSLVSPSGDDVVLKYTYAEAANATSSLWTLSAPTMATIGSKNISVGTGLPAAPAAVTAAYPSGGIINADAVVTQGAIIAGGMVQLADNTLTTITPANPIIDGTCIAGAVGSLRYDTATNNVDVCACPATGDWSIYPTNATSTCNGASPTWIAVGSSAGGGALSSLTAGVAAHTIDSTLYSQTWNWSTLATATTALTLAATNAGGGADTTLAVNNATTGAGYGLSASLTGASNSGYAVYGANTGTTNTGFGGYFSNINGGVALGINGSQTMTVANSGSGTALYKLAVLTGAPSTAVTAATTATAGVIGVVQSGAGTTGSAQIAYAGAATCAFDATATTAGDYVQISSTVAGKCHDVGTTLPTSGEVLGIVTASGAASSNELVWLYMQNAVGSSGSSIPLSSVTSMTASPAALANGTNTLTWGWTNTTTNPFTITGDSLTSGILHSLTSASSALTSGTLLNVAQSSTTATPTGNLVSLSNAATTANTSTTLSVSNATTGAGWAIYGTNATAAALAPTTGGGSAISGIMSATGNTGAAVYAKNATTGAGYGVYSSMSGANTGYAGYFSNSGTGYGIYAGSSSGIGGYFTGNPYALVVPSGGGNVGIGTVLPAANLEVYQTQAQLTGTSNNVVSIDSNSMDNLGAGTPTLLNIYAPYGGVPTGRLFNAANSSNTFSLNNSNQGFTRIYNGTYASPVPNYSAGPYSMLGVSFNNSLADAYTPLVGVGVNMNVTSWSGGTPSYHNVFGVPVEVRGANNISYGVYSDVSGATTNWAFYAVNGNSYLSGLENNGALQFDAMAAPAISTSSPNTAKIYYDSTANILEASVDGGAYGPLGGSSALSSLTPGTVAHTIDSTLFSQVWNWSTLTTGAGLTLGTGATNNLTTGSVLDVASSSTAASGGSTGGLIDSTLSGNGNSGTAVFGANTGTNTGYAGYFTNSGAGYGIYAGSSSGVGGYFASTSGPGLQVVAGATTGTTTTSATSISANALTTGTGLYLASSSLTSGKLADLEVSGIAAAASQTALNILTAGANGTSAITTYGAQISNTHTNATSGTNVGLYLNASGATTANYGLLVNAGNVGIGTLTPGVTLDVNGAVRPGSVTTGAACTGKIGSIGYDSTANGLVYCNNTPVWAATGANSIPLSSVTSMTTSPAALANGTNTLTWGWTNTTTNPFTITDTSLTTGSLLSLSSAANTLTTGSLLNAASSSTAASGGTTSGLIDSTLSGNGNTGTAVFGANTGTNTGYAGYFTNSGAGYGLYAGSSSGVGGYFTSTSGPGLQVVAGATTGTTTTSATSISANALTTGTGLYLASSSLTSGKLADLEVSGTAAAASQTALNILTAGANGTNAITTYGAQISNTHTNATSGTNVGLYLNASGATTANYGLIVNAGNVGIGTTTPGVLLDVNGAVRPGSVTTGAACTGKIGSIGYDSTANGLVYCNNTPVWTSTGSSSIDSLTDAYNTQNVTPFNLMMGTPDASYTHPTGTYNTAVGILALTQDTTGGSNDAFGYEALYNNITGSWNTAIGHLAMFNNEGDIGSTAIGYEAMYYANSEASESAPSGWTGNTAVGHWALRGSVTAASNTGTNNTVMGAGAMINNAAGSNNTAVGYQALLSNAGLGGNTAIGYAAMANANSAATGTNPCCGTPNISGNTAIGIYALLGSATPANNTGVNNIAVGYNSLTQNTSGSDNTASGGEVMYNNSTGSYNTAMGYQAMINNGPGANYNTAVGIYALYGSGTLASNTGTNNVAIGYESMYGNSSGGSNVAVGANAGYGLTGPGTYANTTGSNDTFIGYNAAPGTATQLSNATAIGANASVTASNSLILGNSLTGVGIGTTAPQTLLTVAGPISLQAPSTTNITATTYTVLATDSSLIFTPAATTTVTLPAAASFPGRILWMSNTAAFTIISASSNVIPQIGSAAGTAILPATAGTWAELQSNGTSWVIMASNTFSVGGTINGLGDAQADYTNNNLELGNASTKVAITGGALRDTMVGVGAGHPGSLTAAANDNTSLGYQAMQGNTSGNANTALGETAMYTNTTGYGNIAIGYQALYYNSAKQYSVAIGYQALGNFNGAAATPSGNTAIGTMAQEGLTGASTTGTNNTTVGYQALINDTSGNNNTAIGYQALNSMTTGNSTNSNNTALGYQAGQAGTAITTGDDNTLLGYQAQVNNAAAVNRTAIGSGAIAATDNTVQLGNASVTNVNVGTTSTALTLGPTTSVTAPAGFTIAVTTFTSSGTYTPPTTSTLMYATVEVVGGGGGGGGTDYAGAGGGGGGGYARRTLTAAQIGASQAVTVGGAGLAGASGGGTGGAGGPSQFGAGSLVAANGGSGGNPSTGAGYPSGGAGGAGTTGDFVTTGGAGTGGYTNGASWSGVGGPSHLGGGGVGRSNATSVGAAGGNYGGGGGGALGSNSSFAGGAGAGGIVIVTAYSN
jgi:hypothetical protein